MIAIKKIIDCLSSSLDNIQGIYLFGSYASGDATEKSDVDIAVLCIKRLSFDLKLSLTSSLAMTLNKEVDLVELRYIDTIFKEEIIRTANRIATFDRVACEKYEDYIYCSAMDFREFRSPHVQEIIERGYIHG